MTSLSEPHISTALGADAELAARMLLDERTNVALECRVTQYDLPPRDFLAFARLHLDTSKNVLNFCMEACWVRRGSACRVVVAV